MNAKVLANQYPLLTAEERFRLIVAASARGDGAERDRLVSTGPRVAMRVSDHAHLLLAFHEVALLTYIELQELAAEFCDTDLAAEALGRHRAGETDDGGQAEGAEGAAEEHPGDSPDDGCGARLPWQRLLQLAHAWGFIVRTKAEGWELFCGRWVLPPFVLWQVLPGFDRLRRNLELAEKCAFTREGFLRWLNRVRPAGEPEHTDMRLSVESIAEETEILFRQRIKFWGGD